MGQPCAVAGTIEAPLRRGRVLLVGMRRGGTGLGRALARAGYQPVRAGDGAEALLRLRRGGFVAVLLADELPGIPGRALLPGIRVAWPELPVIFVRAPGAADPEVETLETGAHACLAAPLRAPELLRVLREAAAMPDESGQVPPAVPDGRHGEARRSCR